MATKNLTVYIFGRETPISSDRLDTTAGTLALLTCLEGLSKADAAAIQRVHDLIRRVSK